MPHIQAYEWLESLKSTVLVTFDYFFIGNLKLQKFEQIPDIFQELYIVTSEAKSQIFREFTDQIEKDA